MGPLCPPSSRPLPCTGTYVMSAVLLSLVLLALAGTALDWVRKPVCRYLGSGVCVVWVDEREEIIHPFLPPEEWKTSRDKTPPPDPPLPLPLSACHTYRWMVVVVIWCRRGRGLIVWAVVWSRPLASPPTSTDCYGPPNRVHKRRKQRYTQTYTETDNTQRQSTQTLGKA